MRFLNVSPALPVVLLLLVALTCFDLTLASDNEMTELFQSPEDFEEQSSDPIDSSVEDLIKRSLGKRPRDRGFLGKRGRDRGFLGKRGRERGFLGKRGRDRSFLGKRGRERSFLGKRGRERSFLGKRGRERSFLGKRGRERSFLGKRGRERSFLGKRGRDRGFLGKRSYETVPEGQAEFTGYYRQPETEEQVYLDEIRNDLERLREIYVLE